MRERRGIRRAIHILGVPGIASLVFLILLVALALINPLLPWDPLAQDLSRRLVPPFTPGEPWQYFLGGDQLGRSEAARLLDGARVSLAIAASVAVLSAAIGVIVGIAAALIGGIFEGIVLRVIDIWMSLPTLLIALVVLYLTGPGTWKVVLILVFLRWVTFARVARALTLSIRERQFFEASRATGSTLLRIAATHVFPNLRWDVTILLVLEIASVMLTEASLSFLGLGVQVPASSWGTMLASGRPYLAGSTWIVLLPGVAIVATTLSINLIVNALRTGTDRLAGTVWSGVINGHRERIAPLRLP